MIKPYYETSLGKLYHGSCEDILPYLQNIDLTITSPPYDNLRDYHGYIFNFQRIAGYLLDITKEGGVVVWIVADATINGSETGTSFKQALYFKEIGFNLYDTMFYQKECFPLNHRRYDQSIEYMFIFSKGIPKTFNPILVPCSQSGKNLTGTKRQGNKDDLSPIHGINTKIKPYRTKGNLWFYPSGFQKTTKDKIAFEHPAIFPDALAQDHIMSWSNKDTDTVLDPMCRSGTTLKMAERLGRKWIGIEISEEYCELAAKRIESEASQLKLFR